MVMRFDRIHDRVVERARAFGQRGNVLTTMLAGLVVIFCLGVIIHNNYTADKKARAFEENRKVGQETLLEVAQREDAYFKEHKTYTDDLTALGYTDVEDLSVASPGGLYKVVVTAADAAYFTLVAEPQGDQTGDSKCGGLTFDKRGTAKGARGSDGTACW